MTDDDVEVASLETVYDGYFRMDRYRLRHRLHDGGWSKEVSRELFERGHAAAVLPYDPLRDEVILIEQFRVGAYAAGMHPWLIEIVAGIIDTGESPDEVVRREAVEEAGVDVTDLVRIGRYLASPGGTSETVTLYCGRVDASAAGGIHGLDTEGEDIKVMVVPAADITAMVASGELTNATTIIALQWFVLNREGLRQRWR
jgi:ADP-ribose pyrophosphatase